jgi:hypothetical protein
MWCRESDVTNRIFCIYHAEGEFETYPDDWCSNGILKEPANEGKTD